MKCWGKGDNGRLGQGNTNHYGDDAVDEISDLSTITLGSTVRAISAGEEHTCAFLDDESVKCWGAGGGGKLGQTTDADYGDTNAGGMSSTRMQNIDPINLSP